MSPFQTQFPVPQKGGTKQTGIASLKTQADQLPVPFGPSSHFAIHSFGGLGSEGARRDEKRENSSAERGEVGNFEKVYGNYQRNESDGFTEFSENPEKVPRKGILLKKTHSFNWNRVLDSKEFSENSDAVDFSLR